MAIAQNINVPDPEEREQDVYSPRSEADLEQLIDQMEDVESEDVEDAVRQISEIADDNLRGAVTNHFEAPIRSLNNPEENTVEIQEEYKSEEDTMFSNPEAVEAFNKLLHGQEPPKENAEIVGEEYFLNQNLQGFQDVGNVKWWTLMDEDSYREETRGVRNRDNVDRGLEHLQLDNEGDIHAYRVELDGRPVEPEQVQKLARNLQVRRDHSNPEGNRIPQIMLENDSMEEAPVSPPSEIVFGTTDMDNMIMTTHDFESEYEEARELGLVTDEGNLTLKGWLSAVDLEAADIRSLERKDEVIPFSNLEREHIPGETEEYTEVGNVNLTFAIPEGRFADREEIGDYRAGAKINRTDDYTEFETEDLVEEIIFGKGFGGLSISDVEEGEIRELNRNEMEKVAELMDRNLFASEEILGSEYEERMLDMFERDNARMKNLKVEEADYNIKSIEEIEQDRNDIDPTADRVEEALKWFGYSTAEELIEDAGWDKELGKINEGFENAEVEAIGNDRSQHLTITPDGNKEPEYEILKSVEQCVYDSCKYTNPEIEDGALKAKAESVLPISNLVISSHQEEMIQKGASIVVNRDSSYRETEEYRPDEVRELGSRGIEYSLGSLEDYSDEFQEDVEKMAEEEMIELEDEEENTYIRTRDKKTLKGEAEFKISAEKIIPDYLEVEVSYQSNTSAVAINETLKEIGSALDPMNFESDSYDDTVIETKFDYNPQQRAVN